MKKIMFFAACAAVIMLGSCGNKTTNKTSTTDTVAVDTTVVDSTVVDSVVTDSIVVLK